MKKFLIIICALLLLFTTSTEASAADRVQKKALKYTAISSLHDGLARAMKDNSIGGSAFGFINTKGEWVELDSSNVTDFNEGLAIDSSTPGKFRYINKSKKVVFTLSKGLKPGGAGHLEAVGSFHEGRAIVNKEYHANGAIDKKGKLVIPCKYWGLSDFSHGYAIAAKDGKMGLIDKNGKVVIPFIYQYGKVLTDGFAFTKKSDFWEVWNKPFWFMEHKASSYDVYDADAKLMMTGVSEIIDLDQNLLVTADQDYPYYDSNGLQIDQYKIADTAGEVLYTAPDGKSISSLGDGLFSLNESYYESQLIDSHGKLTSETNYTYIGDFSGDYAVVQSDDWKEGRTINLGKYGIIDKKGKEVVPCKYDLESDTYDSYIENNYVIMKDPKTGKSVLFTLP